MVNNYKAIIKSFSENFQNFRMTLKFQNLSLKRLVAFIYSLYNRTLDNGKIDYCYKLIKGKTKWYSSFRGQIHILVAGLLALEDEPEMKLERVLKIHKLLKEQKFRSSYYLVLLSYLFVGSTDILDLNLTVKKTKILYKGMKENHSILTSPRDYIFAGLMATSELDSNILLKRAENYYQNLREDFSIGPSLIALSHILSLSEEPYNLKSKCLKIKDKLIEKGIKMYRHNVLSSLGLLTLLPLDVAEISNRMHYVFEELRSYHDFKNWLILKQEVQIYATAIVTWDYINSEKDPLALVVEAKDVILANLFITIIMIVLESNSH